MTRFTLGSAEPGTGTFRAVLWKELREEFQWGVLGLLVVTAGVVVGLNDVGSAGSLSQGLFALVSMSALVAILIGLTQTVSESRGDAWGFQVHRPVGRSTLFAAKVSAGLIVYCIATGVPVFAAALWFATSGRRAAPFDWSMAFPAVADVLCGLVYYFLALTAGMRDARSLNRGLSIAPGIICSVLVDTAQTFPGAIAVSSVAVLISGIAAWGTFISGGRYASQRTVSRAALGATVAGGLLVAGLIAEWTLGSALQDKFSLHLSSYAVARDGRIATMERTGTGDLLVADLAGHPIDRPSMPGEGVTETDLRLTPPPTPGYRDEERATIGLGVSLRPSGTVWWFVRRAGLIAGYDVRTRHLIGWIGPDGFTEASAIPAKRFADPISVIRHSGNVPEVLAFPNAIYRLSLESRSVELVFDPPRGEVVLDAKEEGGEQGAPLPRDATTRGGGFAERPYYAIATTGHVFVIPGGGDPDTLVVPRDPRARSYAALAVFRVFTVPGDPAVVMYYPDEVSPRELAAETRPTLVSEYLGSDTVVRSALPPLKATVTEPSDRIIVYGLMMPPTIHALNGLGDVGKLGILGDNPFWSSAQRTVAMEIAIVVSLLSAAVTFGLGRRAALPSSRLWLWAVVGAALGAYGVVLMLALIEWPARVPCPVCGLGRVVTHERCEHCGGAFARPAPDGTEIFEPMPA